MRGWLSVMALLLSALNIVWTWHRAGRVPTEEAVKELDRVTDEHARRIQTIEGELRHLPSKDDIAKVNLQLAQLLGRVDVVQTELAGTSRSIRRMEDHFRVVGQ